MPDFQLDATGLQTPRFPEARALVVEKWKARFGDNAQTGSDSPDGLVIDVIALMLALAWEGVASVYASSFFRTAAGVSLDLVLDLFGRQRLSAVASTASCVWYGDTAVLVPEGSVASVTDTEVRFASDGDVTTVAQGDGGPMVVRILAAVDGETYAIDIDTMAESTVVAGGGSTPESIADALAAELASDNPGATVARAGEDADGQALIVLEGLGAGVVTIGGSATTPGNQDVRFGARVAMTAEQTGPNASLAGTLNTTETSIASIDGVCSTTDADVGRDLETDPAFRSRHLDQLNSGGAGSPEAIRARLLALLDSSGDSLLDYVRVFENESEMTDSEGRPPHSFETVWVGPAGAATELTVATEIIAAKPAGIQPYGSISTNVSDSLGGFHAIGHSRGTERYLHLDVTIVPGEGYPTTGDPLSSIESAIVEYLDRDGDGELGLGQDFYRFSLGRPINEAVPGVASATITADDTTLPGDGPALLPADIVVAENTILRVDSSRVAVHL